MDGMNGEERAAVDASNATSTTSTNGTEEEGGGSSGGGKKEGEPAVATEEELLEACRQAKMNVYKTYEEVPEGIRRRCRPSCFPPPPSIASSLNLHYTMRCLHHDHDTGGFFIAIIRKVAPIPEWTNLEALRRGEQSVAGGEENEEEERGGGRGRGGGGGGGGSFTPYEYYSRLPEEEYARVKEFYGLTDDFRPECLFLRNGGTKVVTYMTKALSEDVVEVSDSKIQVGWV